MRLLMDWGPFGLRGGVQKYGGILFDVRGEIDRFGQDAKLSGSTRTKAATGIPIGRRTQRLHFRHYAQWGGVPEGTEIASVQVHYAGGPLERISHSQPD